MHWPLANPKPDIDEKGRLKLPVKREALGNALEATPSSDWKSLRISVKERFANGSGERRAQDAYPIQLNAAGQIQLPAELQRVLGIDGEGAAVVLSYAKNHLLIRPVEKDEHKDAKP